MKLAKPKFDIGLATNHLEPMLRFWQDEVGLPFDHLLRVRRGMDQHRHDLKGSVLKINHLADPLPQTPSSGASSACSNTMTPSPAWNAAPDVQSSSVRPRASA